MIVPKVMKLACALLGFLLWSWTYAGTKHYYYTDPQGTVLAKADAQGNVIATYEYLPYGTQALGTPPDGPAGYTGHVNDAESGLVYMQQRYYDPYSGRFLSVDPMRPISGNWFNFNRYDYANNNPYRFTDPDGRQSYEDMSLTGMYADELLREGEVTKEQHLDMWASGAKAGATGLFTGLAVSDGAIVLRGGFSRLLVAGGWRQAAREFTVESTQLGKKLGQHVRDFGGNPASASDRAAVTRLINEIGTSPTKVVSGSWRGLGEGGRIGPAEFRIKGANVVVTTPKGEFVTILKDGINNSFVKSALEASR